MSQPPTFSPKEWSTLTKTALKAWHRPINLGEHPLTQLATVQQHRTKLQQSADPTGYAHTLRDLLTQAIAATAPPDSAEPNSDTHPNWLDPTWRSWAILTLLYRRRLARGLVQSRIGLAEGGQYYVAQKRAITALASILQAWEKAAWEQATQHRITSAESRKMALRSDTPRIDLKTLTWPGGAVHLNDPLYIKRGSDHELSALLTQPRQSGQTVTIRGPRQVGKTSLLVRGVEAASGSRSVYIDLQSFSQDDLADYDSFLRLLADWLLDELDLDVALAERAWRSRLGAARKLTKLLERHILPAAEAPIVLAFDEVDRLTTTRFGSDFFGLLRSWHNLRSRSPLWERLAILMAISTEPYLLIADLQQSPFNVGRTLHLSDFSLEQTAQLNHIHGAHLSTADTSKLWRWTGGQPFLTRLAFYTLLTTGQTLDAIMASTPHVDSPFANHLSHLWRLIQTDPALANTLRTVLAKKPAADSDAVFRLLKAGLINQSGSAIRCRCPLYHAFFTARLA